MDWCTRVGLSAQSGRSEQEQAGVYRSHCCREGPGSVCSLSSPVHTGPDPALAQMVPKSSWERGGDGTKKGIGEGGREGPWQRHPVASTPV